MSGTFRLVGKGPLDKEIGNEAFVGRPVIPIARMVEEDDVVIAEDAVRVKKKRGGLLNVVFRDVFVMKNTKIKQLTSYPVELK